MSFLRQLYGASSLVYLCSLFGKSRQAWYEAQQASHEQGLKETFVLTLVRSIRQRLPRSGVPQLRFLLKPQLDLHGIRMGRDALYDLLDRHGYLLRYRRRRAYTTDSNHPYRKYTNLVRELVPLRPGHLLVSDITYLRLSSGKFCYLSIITDAYSHMIIGYSLHPSLQSQGPVEALIMAVKSLSCTYEIIHHSDRGIQYCCHEYVRILNEHKVKISMTQGGDPYENTIAEQLNGILKQELELDKTFNSFTQAEQSVNKAVECYNNYRPHSSCDYLTPAEANKRKGPLRVHWKDKRYLISNQ